MLNCYIYGVYPNNGYNGIPLNTPPAGTKIKLEFEGIAGNPHFRKINVEQAGWR